MGRLIHRLTLCVNTDKLFGSMNPQKSKIGCLCLLASFLVSMAAPATATVSCDKKLVFFGSTQALLDQQSLLKKRLDDAFSVEAVDRKFDMLPDHRDYWTVTDLHRENTRRNLAEESDWPKVDRLIADEEGLRRNDWIDHWEVVSPKVGVQNTGREYGIVYLDPEADIFGPKNHTDIMRDGATSEKNNWVGREVVIILKEADGFRSYRGKVKQMYYGFFGEDGLYFVSRFELERPDQRPITVPIKGAQVQGIFRSRR
jgi:hypothetical protein